MILREVTLRGRWFGLQRLLRQTPTFEGLRSAHSSRPSPRRQRWLASRRFSSPSRRPSRSLPPRCTSRRPSTVRARGALRLSDPSAITRILSADAKRRIASRLRRFADPRARDVDPLAAIPRAGADALAPLSTRRLMGGPMGRVRLEGVRERRGRVHAHGGQVVRRRGRGPGHPDRSRRALLRHLRGHGQDFLQRGKSLVLQVRVFPPLSHPRPRRPPASRRPVPLPPRNVR